MTMRRYGRNGSTKGLGDPQFKKTSPYIDAADISNFVMPGFRIRNRKKKRRVQNKATRQTVKAAIINEVEEMV